MLETSELEFPPRRRVLYVLAFLSWVVKMVEVEVEAGAEEGVVQLVADTIMVPAVGEGEEAVGAVSIALEEGAGEAEAVGVGVADTAQELVSIGEGAGEAEGATEEVVGAAGAEAAVVAAVPDRQVQGDELHQLQSVVHDELVTKMPPTEPLSSTCPFRTIANLSRA